MANCQIKKGMFVLNECGEIAKAQCSQCGKNVCSKHAEQEGEQIICVECFAKREFEEGQNNNFHRKPDTHNGTNNVMRNSLAMDSLYYYHWQSQMRHGFYNNYEHRPFDEKDYAGFEETNQTEFDDTNDTGGFFDS